MQASLTFPPEGDLFSGDNPVYIGDVNRGESRTVNWTLVFTSSGIFDFDVNASGYRVDTGGYVETHGFAGVTIRPHYTDIDVETAYNMITSGLYPNLVVLDVRTQGEYGGGHVYGAVWIPVSELEARIGELAGQEDHEIIVYCRSGVRSVTASEILYSHNFTKVYNMLGGILSWQSAGYPVWIATVHNVNTTFNYDTIQAAIDAPQTLDGHQIAVDIGTYDEHVVVKKALWLIGENKQTTIIDGNGMESVVRITANNVKVTGFTIQNGYSGLISEYCNDSVVSGNLILNNQVYGIALEAADNNEIIGNTIGFSAGTGIYLYQSQDNIIYHNSFIQNWDQVYSEDSINAWDDDYPSGGNYWSDYADVDLFSGTYQNMTGSDGIVDKPYDIDENNRDRYPLMKPYGGPHDIGIVNVTTSETMVVQGQNLSINVKVVNYGANNETFNVTTYANQIVLQTKTITLASRNSTTVTFAWNTTGFAKGKYTISSEAHPVPDEIDTTDNSLIDGPLKVILQAHDIAVTDIVSYKTVVGEGCNASVDITVENWGNYTETFNVTAYCDPGNATAIPIETQTVTLASGNSATVTFTWNTTGVAKGNYTISAYATPVSGEIDTTDNTLTEGWIIVAMIGDITGPEGYPDGKCDIRDVALVATKFGAIYPGPRYDPNCDITGPTQGVADGKIDIRDIATVAKNFGKIDP